MSPRFLWLLLLLAAAADSADVYRYQDADGRWRFSDKKPNTIHDTVTFKQEAREPEPALLMREVNGLSQLYLSNPWWAPVQFELSGDEGVALSQVVAAQSEILLEPGIAPQGLRYRYTLGDPAAVFNGEPLAVPVAAVGKFRISQGFNGAFSHTDEANRYAVDIAMQVGDDVVAAREGTVVTVKDDYHMGGQNDFFIDKANLVRVLHSDGSFAVYGHILLGSAAVQPGQTVGVGQKLARCGSSGFSTGPHLHFVVQVARKRGWQSVPFQFVQRGKPRTPAMGDWLQAE